MEIIDKNNMLNLSYIHGHIYKYNEVTFRHFYMMSYYTSDEGYMIDLSNGMMYHVENFYNKDMVDITDLVSFDIPLVRDNLRSSHSNNSFPKMKKEEQFEVGSIYITQTFDTFMVTNKSFHKGESRNYMLYMENGRLLPMTCQNELIARKCMMTMRFQ